MTPQAKNAIIGVVIGLGIFFLLKKNFSSALPGATAAQPEVTAQNIQIVLDAYTSAVGDNQPQSTLNELNTATSTEYGLRVYQRKSDGVFIVTDLSGKQVN